MESVKIVAEYAGKNWSGYSTNLAGVFVTAESLEALLDEYVVAVRFHVDGLALQGEPIPAVDLGTYLLYPVVYLEHIGDFRKSLGLTQTDMATELGVTQSRISEIERNPDVVAFGKVREYLSVIEVRAGIPPIALVTESTADRIAI